MSELGDIFINNILMESYEKILKIFYYLVKSCSLHTTQVPVMGGCGGETTCRDNLWEISKGVKKNFNLHI